MRAVEITRFGSPEVPVETTRPVPRPGPGEVLVRVSESGVNRPGVLQREGEYRDELERKHEGRRLCIEPRSGRYFLGDTFDQAVDAAVDEFPDRLTHTLRLGFRAANVFHKVWTARPP